MQDIQLSTKPRTKTSSTFPHDKCKISCPNSLIIPIQISFHHHLPHPHHIHTYCELNENEQELRMISGSISLSPLIFRFQYLNSYSPNTKSISLNLAPLKYLTTTLLNCPTPSPQMSLELSDILTTRNPEIHN